MAVKIEKQIQETTKAEIENQATTEGIKYSSPRRFWEGITKLLTVNNFWALLQSFNFITTKQLYTTKQSFVVVGSNPIQSINLDNGSYVSIDLTGASGSLTLTLSNGKVGGSYFIQVTQAATAVDINTSNVGRLDGGVGNLIEGTDSQNYVIVVFYTGTGFIVNNANLT